MRVWGVRALSLMLIGYALFGAISRTWVCDDAFISFRYAENLWLGKGLVWNPGEYVEGITNLLWTLLFLPVLAVGGDPVRASEWMGIASYAAVLFAAWAFARRSDNEQVVRAPIALWILCVVEDLHVWATGGLETTFVAALIVAMAALLAGPKAGPARQVLAGFVGGLVFLARPDAVLVAACLGLGAAYREWPSAKASAKTLMRIAGPVALIVVAATAFRLAYYGDWVPNTFHAKSASASWWMQGARYFGVFFIRNHGLAVLTLLSLVAILIGRWRGLARWEIGWRAGLWGAVVVFALYLLRSGGDYMHARRFLPVLPLLVIAAAAELSSVIRREGVQLVVGVLLTAMSAVAYPVIERRGQGHVYLGIVDEPFFYPRPLIELRRRQGEALGQAFAGISAGFVIEGGLCMLAYYSKLPLVIEGNGLMDRTIARQTVSERTIHGHEKHPTVQYLDQRRIQFGVLKDIPEQRRRFNVVELSAVGLYLRARYYDPKVMEALSQRPGVVALAEPALSRVIQRELSQASCQAASSTYGAVRRYLSMAETSGTQLARFAEQVSTRCGTIAP